MAPIYEHRQFGALTVGAISGLMVVVLLIGSFVVETPEQGGTVISVVAVTLLLILLIFSSLTVRVYRDAVELRFGIGMIRKRFPTGRIVQAKPVRNAWWYGWGIRLTPHGWLFNVSGLDAVELLMGDGRKYRIGTDEPEALAAAINGARKTR